MRNPLSGFSRNTFLLAAGSLFADLATEMLTPILPIFLTQVLGASGSIIGLVDGIAQAVRNIVDGLFGPLADKLRARRAVALAGYAIGALAKPLMGFSTIWQAVLGGRVLDRVGAGILSAPRDALVASSTDQRHKGRGFGLQAFGENAGAFLGPLLTVLLFWMLGLELRTIFYLATIPALLAFAMVLLVRSERDASGRDGAGIDPRRLPAGYWKFIAITALFCIGNSSNSFLILQVQELGGSILLTTLVYAAFNFVAALTSYPAGFLADKWGRRTVLFGSFLVALIVYSGVSITQSFAVTVAIFVFYGIYEGTFRSVGRTIASELAPEEMRATAIGWFSMTAGLCQLAANLIAGQLWDRLGHSAAFMLGAGTSAGGLIALGIWLRLNAKPR